MNETNLFDLFLGTIIYRPYVYVFFLCYLVFAFFQLGIWRTALFTINTYLIAFGCEYSSTRNGFPFGIYHYIDTTRTRELWISNIPFWDSLSFVFLSYFSWNLAAAVFSQEPSRSLRDGLLDWRSPLLGGLLMMLLDVVIDPLTVLGDRWFLGQIYYYPSGGPYFGVTLENFGGWFFVGFTSQWIFQKYLKSRAKNINHPHPLFAWGIFGVYAGVFVFNWSITLWIQEYSLLAASSLIIVATLFPLALYLKRRASLWSI